MTDTSKVSLRERTRQVMRAEVSTIATRLFAEQGCDNTTVEQIAAEAGLSRTTFFRYFGTKEDVVLTWLADLGPGLATALRDRPAGEDPWVSLRRTFDVLTTINATEPEKSLAFYRMLDRNPTMGPRHRDKQDGWVELLVPVITVRLGTPEPAPRALVSAAMACFNAAMREWVGGGGTGSRGELLDRAMTAVRSW
ncbi:MAG TPA: TetR family transcriptional regulator [Actinoplanes sp.]|nr:TetR family transcriptional regulator [Actinoplanes sp.]